MFRSDESPSSLVITNILTVETTFNPFGRVDFCVWKTRDSSETSTWLGRTGVPGKKLERGISPGEPIKLALLLRQVEKHLLFVCKNFLLVLASDEIFILLNIFLRGKRRIYNANLEKTKP